MKQSKLYRRVSTAGLAGQPNVAKHAPPMRSLWHTHIRGCLRRDVQNLITIDEYAELTSATCFYCGRSPFNPTKWPGLVLLYNGIDRVDNSLPYTKENLVTCCKDCNAMKSGRDAEQFLQHVVRVAEHLGWHGPDQG